MKSELEKYKHQINRRQFLAAVGAAGASMFAFGSTAAASATAARPQPGGALSLASLRQVEGTRFVIKYADSTLRATLDRVVEDKTCAALEQFTATFTIEDKTDGQLVSDVYQLQHPELGNISLLLTPSESDKMVTATFCQLVG